MYPDIEKAHLAPKREQDVYIELPCEAEVKEEEEEEEYGKLIHWAAQAWEEHFSALPNGHGFNRLRSVLVAFVHRTHDLMGVANGDDFVFVGLGEDRDFVFNALRDRDERKHPGRLGRAVGDAKKLDVLGRVVEITYGGGTSEGYPWHKRPVEEYCDRDKSVDVLTNSGHPEDHERGGGGNPTSMRRPT